VSNENIWKSAAASKVSNEIRPKTTSKGLRLRKVLPLLKSGGRAASRGSVSNNSFELPERVNEFLIKKFPPASKSNSNSNTSSLPSSLRSLGNNNKLPFEGRLRLKSNSVSSLKSNTSLPPNLSPNQYQPTEQNQNDLLLKSWTETYKKEIKDALDKKGIAYKSWQNVLNSGAFKEYNKGPKNANTLNRVLGQVGPFLTKKIKYTQPLQHFKMPNRKQRPRYLEPTLGEFSALLSEVEQLNKNRNPRLNKIKSLKNKLEKVKISKHQKAARQQRANIVRRLNNMIATKEKSSPRKAPLGRSRRNTAASGVFEAPLSKRQVLKK
jgi:hypothetical protein